MPRKKNSKQSANATADGLLRSINVAFDADYPERIAHFRPTSKSVAVLEALLGQRRDGAYFITAPYGSGKSLVAAYALQIIENRDAARSVVTKLADRIDAVNPAMAKKILARCRSKSKRGLAVALHGAHADLSGALESAANASLKRCRKKGTRGPIPTIKGNSDPIVAISNIVACATARGFDSVAIIWDEFGRHLEDLLARGAASELTQLQTMAELASRSEKLPVTLALITHRGLAQYATSAPQAVRGEWAKVEGRFEAIQYVDDSKEMYRLIAESVAARRLARLTPADKKWLRSEATKARSVGLFKELKPVELVAVFELAYPLHPVALYALPRIAARVSQNERTIFGFLAQNSFSRLVGTKDIYEFFADSMRSDTGAGGAYRQYLETETAVRRAKSEREAEILKTACLLSLGFSGERGQVSRDLLQLAASAPGWNAGPTIDALIDRKLLLHRKHSNDVSVWHGADVDLRGALEDAKDRSRTGFNLLEFLKKEIPAPIWRPVRFNDDFCIKRFFAGRYVSVQQLQSAIARQNATMLDRKFADGLMLYVLAERTSEQEQAIGLLGSKRLPERVVVAVPTREVSVAEPALEVACLEQMLRDPSLTERDPLIEIELKHLLDDARAYLHRAVRQLIMPHASGPNFWHGAAKHEPKSAAELRLLLSDIAADVYPMTPRLNNEMINRHKVSAIVTNARKKLEMAVLERSGVEGLGIEGNFPDASIFRTVLLNTQLYRRSETGAYRYAFSNEIPDPGLQRVWEELRRFFQESGEPGPKQFTVLFDTLMAPPIGLRQGVLPVLLAAGFRAFPVAVSLRQEGNYVEDVLPSVIEEICKKPESFVLEVLSLTKPQTQVLAAVKEVFGNCNPALTHQSDDVRLCFDSIQSWVASLSPAALKTGAVSDAASAFRKVVIARRDPVRLLFTDLPAVLGRQSKPKTVAKLEEIRGELEDVVGAMRSRALLAVRRLLDSGSSREGASLAEVCQRWVKCFPVADLQQAAGLQAVAFINRLEQRYDSDELLLDSIASLLVDQPTSRWDDATLVQFERALADIVSIVESEAVRLVQLGGASKVVKNNLARLIESRIGVLYGNLVAIRGHDAAVESVVRVTKTRQ